MFTVSMKYVFRGNRFVTKAWHEGFYSTQRKLGASRCWRMTFSAIPNAQHEEHHGGIHPNCNKDSSADATPFMKNPVPNFNDAQAAYETKSNAELARALVSFGLCQVPFLVKHAERILSMSRRVSPRLTDAMLKYTLFGHFCAGESEPNIQPAIAALEQAGIGSILDFAAEEDIAVDSKSKKEKEVVLPLPDKPPKVRVYDYESEAVCDQHVDVFKQCIHHVKNLGKDGYAAIKVTALVNPKLLQRMSRAILEVQALFSKFDVDKDGYISRDEFKRGFELFFREDDVKLKEMLEQPIINNGQVDYITWSMLLTPHDLPRITAACRLQGPLALATPTEEEVELIEKMYERGHELAQEAAQCGTRLLIDAEQQRFQPAIDNLVLDLQKTYNAYGEQEHPIIYNTYQCYLKDAPYRLRTDVERSERFNYNFGAKLVRGAYMESERALAKSVGNPSPIFDTIEETHKCYNDSVRFLLEHSINTNRKQVEVMLATHNQQSIEKAIDVMNELGIDHRQPTVCFGQLYGMMDHLTYNLGKHGYRAYKYVPYGPIHMVMPYLIRRANENSSVRSGARKELSMVTRELKRRLLGRT